MIEVFKTNVREAFEANMLLNKIHELTEYKANFDLEDHDSILRVKSNSGSVDPELIINIVEYLGFNAEVLEDEFIS